MGKTARRVGAIIVWLILALVIMWLMGRACAPPAGADGDGGTAASPPDPLSLGAPTNGVDGGMEGSILAVRAAQFDCLPQDPFQRCAQKALWGWYGELEDWQWCAYDWGLAKGVSICGVAKVTSYGDRWEHESPYDCRGRRLQVGVCAANPEIPLDAIIWIDGVGLRRVADRGGKVKLHYTNNRESANLDVYTLAPVETRRNVQYARVKR